MSKRFIPLLTILLCSPTLAVAQMPAPEAYARSSPDMAASDMLTPSETVSANMPALAAALAPSAEMPVLAAKPALPARVVPAEAPALRAAISQFRVSPAPISQNAGQYAGPYVNHFNLLLAGGRERDEGRLSLPAMIEVNTLFLSQSILPLAQLWHGRVQLDGTTSTVNMANIQLGPTGGVGLHDFHPIRQKYPDNPRSVDLYGLSLSFHFGRVAQASRPQIWRLLAQNAHQVRADLLRRGSQQRF